MSSHRFMLGTVAGVLAAIAAAGVARAELPALPKSPIVVNIIDVAGNLALTQKAMENYRKAHPELVSRFTFTKAPAPELAGKIKAQQGAGRVDIDLVLTGTDGLAAGIEQKLWINLLQQYPEKFPNLEANYLPGAVNMQKLAEGFGITVALLSLGTLARVRTGAGQGSAALGGGAARLVQGAPEPADVCAAGEFRPRADAPHGSALPPRRQQSVRPDQRLGQDLGLLEGAEHLHRVLSLGDRRHDEGAGRGLARHHRLDHRLDINPRVLGVVPKSAQITTLKGFHWVTDAHYMVVPSGLAPTTSPSFSTSWPIC